MRPYELHADEHVCILSNDFLEVEGQMVGV